VLSVLIKTSDFAKTNRDAENRVIFPSFGKKWIGFIWHRIGNSKGLCEHGNELSGSIKCEEFLD
jgi:hypothetical protein